MREIGAKCRFRLCKLAKLHRNPRQILRLVVLSASVGALGNDEDPRLLFRKDEHGVGTIGNVLAADGKRGVGEESQGLAAWGPYLAVGNGVAQRFFFGASSTRRYSTASCLLESKLQVVLASAPN